MGGRSAQTEDLSGSGTLKTSPGITQSVMESRTHTDSPAHSVHISHTNAHTNTQSAHSRSDPPPRSAARSVRGPSVGPSAVPHSGAAPWPNSSHHPGHTETVLYRANMPPYRRHRQLPSQGARFRLPGDWEGEGALCLDIRPTRGYSG